MRALLATIALMVSFPSASLRLALADLLSGKYTLDRRTWVSIATLPDSAVLFFGGETSQFRFKNFLRLQDGILSNDTMQYPGAGSLNNLLFVKNNYLYAGGGRDSSIAKYSFTDFWRRNVRTNEWERLRDLPFLYQYTPYASMDKETLFLVDKVTSWDKHTVYTQQVLLRYRATDDAWDSLSSCPKITPFDTPIYFESDTCIYVLLQSRGYNSKEKPKHHRFFSVSKSDYSWKELAPFPVEGHELATGYYQNGMGYVCGGGLWGASEDAIFRYDVVQNKWSFDRMGPSMSWFYTFKQGGDWYAGFGCVDGLPITKTRIFKLTGENASPPTK